MSKLVRSRKSRVSAVLATAAVAVGLVAAPASQAQPVITGGLVNVTVANNEILENVGVGVAAGVAANLCGVSVNAAVLGVIRDDDTPGEFVCEATATGNDVVISQD